MALIAGGILWASQVPVHGHFWSALAGPFFVTGAGSGYDESKPLTLVSGRRG